MPGTGFVHEALFYDSDDELLAFAVPYLRSGLAAGEHTAFFGDERETGLVQRALGGDPRLLCLPQLDRAARPARTYSLARDLVARQILAGAARARFIGRPNFGGTPAQRARWSRYEAVLNHALSGVPLTAVCLYDTRRESAEVIETGLRTHPRVSTADGGGPNPSYVAPAEYVAEPAVTRPAADPLVHLPGVTDAGAARRAVTAAVLGGRPPTEEREDIVTAIAEVVENAVRHGRPPVDVRVWVGDAEVVGEVTDHGPGIADRLAGYRPLEPAELRTGPLGLWLARRLCDDLDYSHADGAFTVRLRTSLSP